MRRWRPRSWARYLRDLRALLDEYQYQHRLLRSLRPRLHPHAGQLRSAKPSTGIRKYGEFVDRAADLVVGYGGSLSGEHGDGQSRGALLPKMFGDELMRRVSRVQGRSGIPTTRLNPHKVVDAYLPTENLRLGADYAPRAAAHALRISRRRRIASSGRRSAASAWANAASTMRDRCARATWSRSRKSTARAAARTCCSSCCRAKSCAGGWKDEHVKQSLDLCLSCKACKSECPANVDMATYRAEFLSHYYEGSRRPLHAYAFGHDRSMAASSRPSRRRLANALTQAPGSADIARRVLQHRA